MTKQATKVLSKSKASGGRKKNTLRDKTARRKRGEKQLLLVAGIIAVVMVAAVIYFNVRSGQPVGNEEVLASLGNMHIDQNSPSPITYNSMPPTSGPHYGGIARWGIHTEPIRYEQLIHNLEDGGVIVYYQCEDGCPDLVGQLEEVVAPFERAGSRVILIPNDPTWTIGNNNRQLHQDMEARIALTAWQRIDKFDEFDAGRIRAFIDRYEGIDHHAG